MLLTIVYIMHENSRTHVKIEQNKIVINYEHVKRCVNLKKSILVFFKDKIIALKLLYMFKQYIIIQKK